PSNLRSKRGSSVSTVMSRGVAGFIDRSLVVTLPGSRGGASESMAAILPALVHIFDVCRDLPHPGGYE
ncbi:hypothetical protein ACSRC3_17035, partial [Acinetobacter baumannii]